MLFGPFVFLVQLKKIQQSEENYISINDQRKSISRRTATAIEGSRCFSKKWHKVYSMLDYLEKEGCIETVNSSYRHLTYDGFHYAERIFADIRSFLFKSIAVPILVAFVTTLISLWLTGVFSAQ